MDIPSHCRQNEFQIRSQEDMQELSSCDVLVGNVIITDFDYPIITFSNLEKILGNLTIRKCPEVVRIEAPVMELISGSFTMFELTSLALISYPALKWVNVLDWRILPILSNVHFNNEIQGIESITISDTSLTGFSGFLADTIENLDINNNRFLDTIESNVEVIRGKLHIGANANDAKVSLPKLKQINRLSVSNVERLNVDELESVEESLSLANNYFQQIKFPKLSYVGGTLSLSGNEMVNDLEFPNLSELGGGLVLTNNSLIERVNFFPKLRIIGGALELVGAIKEISLKNLKLCKGSASVKSTSPLFDCAKWSRSEIVLVVRGGKIECTDANNEKITSRTKDDGGELITNTTLDVEYHENKSNLAVSTTELSSFQFVAILITLILSLVSF
ncbi:Sporulation-specific protein 22 [Candida viswanathii]|uniref:Sporulation-specific protein 22 n=1 Tax=Candida viswanathii TaxID=5486 RepID=A0A367YD78_9ASCO|nr:Sporulation-specific protein 22 [Candida viswanathii]